MELDTFNRFMVRMDRDGLRVGYPPAGTLKRHEAVNLAVYLVALADPGREKFDPLLKAVLEERRSER